MLTASAAGGEYAGNLCVYGEAQRMPFVDETVRFTLQPFDAQMYKDAGGSLPGSFDAFGVPAGGRCIVLIDGERPLIEMTDSGMTFYGALIAENEAGEAQRIADETKQLMRTLYDGADKSKADIGKIPETLTGKPPWYPDWLLPKPDAPYGWIRTEMFNLQGFNRYQVKYTEELLFYDIFENYAEQLSRLGYENYTVCDPDWGEGAIYFTKGVYSIMILIIPHGNVGTELLIYIT
jgi:hypothetical protein